MEFFSAFIKNQRNIGSLKASNGTWYLFDGFLDELYWSRALTENEVQNLYSSTILKFY